VIVRGDLPRGLQAAQLVHAAGESSDEAIPPGTHAVVLVCPDRHALAAEAYRLTKLGVKFTAILEPDPPYYGEIMAIGLHPGRKEDLRRHLSSLPLLR
jgi:peptidyl-tRNA hydrolase